MSVSSVEILLVEDNPNDVELTLHAFARFRLANRVHVARDGQEALDYLFGSMEHGVGRGPVRPKVVLLDLKLPKVDGLDVLRAIKADKALRTLPIVVLTSSREERDIVDSYELGVNSYIVKPIDFDKFVEAVQAIGFYWLLLNEPPVEAGAG
jgi:two-component system response regulator